MDYKNYFKSLRFFIILSLIIFCLSIAYGYFSAQRFPEQAKETIEQFSQVYRPILEAGPLAQFLLVFLNNSITVFLTIILAIIFGLFPLAVIFSNGLILGVFLSIWQQEMPWSGFLKGLLPHGLIEIPILLTATAIGLKIGQLAIKKVFQKEGQLKPELTQALKFFLIILLPLLVLAAFLEIFVTPLFIK